MNIFLEGAGFCSLLLLFLECALKSEGLRMHPSAYIDFAYNPIQLTTHGSLEIKDSSSIMTKTFILLLFSAYAGYSQPYYTRLRAGLGGEARGISPRGQLYTELFFAYKARSFANVSAGVGIIEGRYLQTFSLSNSLTYCYLLNASKRNPCQPRPGFNRLESYLEAGGATFFVNSFYLDKYTRRQQQYRALTPIAVLGVRLHFITRRWIYILKVRMTPALLDQRLAAKSGVAVAVGWR